MRLPLLASALILCAAAFPSIATQPAGSLRIDSINIEQAQIRADVEARRGPYKNLSPAAREQLLAKQAAVLGLINGKQAIGELNEQQRNELVATLDSIDAILKRSKDDRLVCEARKKTGSNRKERVCRTAAQVIAEREATRNQLNRTGMQGVTDGR